MPKQEIKKIRPLDSIKSLELYNEKVVALVQSVGIALHNDLVEDIIKDSLQNALDEVKEFYKD